MLTTSALMTHATFATPGRGSEDAPTRGNGRGAPAGTLPAITYSRTSPAREQTFRSRSGTDDPRVLWPLTTLPATKLPSKTRTRDLGHTAPTRGTSSSPTLEPATTSPPLVPATSLSRRPLSKRRSAAFATRGSSSVRSRTSVLCVG